MADHFDEYQPRGARERRLSESRPKRTRKAARTGEPLVVSRPRAAKSELRKQIERGLNRDTAGSELSRQLAFAVRASDRKQVAVARGMLYALERRSARLLESPAAAAGVVRLARHHEHFIRDPRDIEPTGATPAEQLRQLANVLLEKWPVPHWLDDAWMHADVRKHQWFVHLGAGKNLSDAPALPFELSKRMAHFAVNAPRGLSAVQALRWAQSRGLNTPEELCQEIVHTRLSNTLPDEPFWRQVVGWFAAHPEVYGHVNVIVDYLFAQRIGDFARPRRPDFTMRGRAPDRLLADAQAWHDEVYRQRQLRRTLTAPQRWKSCGIEGLRPTVDREPATTDAPEPLPAWAIVELLSFDDLVFEGERLHHCVASYASVCATGRSAIFSLRRLVDDALQPHVTIEIYPEQRRVVQARAAQNAYANDADRKLIEAWTKSMGLTIESFVFATHAPARRPRR
jgi:hypothetical protein